LGDEAKTMHNAGKTSKVVTNIHTKFLLRLIVKMTQNEKD